MGRKESAYNVHYFADSAFLYQFLWKLHASLLQRARSIITPGKDLHLSGLFALTSERYTLVAHDNQGGRR